MIFIIPRVWLAATWLFFTWNCNPTLTKVSTSIHKRKITKSFGVVYSILARSPFSSRGQNHCRLYAERTFLYMNIYVSMGRVSETQTLIETGLLTELEALTLCFIGVFSRVLDSTTFQYLAIITLNLNLLSSITFNIIGVTTNCLNSKTALGILEWFFKTPRTCASIVLIWIFLLTCV